MTDTRNEIYNINKEQCASQGMVDRQFIEARQLTESTSNVELANIQSEGVQSRAEVERFGFYNANQTQRAADRGYDETQKLGLYNADKIESNGDRNYSATRNGVDAVSGKVDSGFRQVEVQAASNKGHVELQAANNKASMELQAANNKAEIELQANTNANAASVLANLNSAAIQLQATTNQNSAEITAERNANSASVQANLNAYNVSLAATSNFNALTVQNNLVAAAAELLAVKNQAALEAKIAECCCEQRALILETSNATQLLIRSQQEQNLRDRLIEQNAEINNLKLRASLLPALTPAVTV